MYDASLYEVGSGYNARIKNGAVLYRLASLAHCDPASLISGEGPSRSTRPGRFNEPQQRASYCANNVLVCLAEVLFHMYRTLLDRIRWRQPVEDIRRAAISQRALVVFRVQDIDALVYLDTDDIRADYDGRVTGTTVVFPDPDYQPLRDLNKAFREAEKRGAFYPSARHSNDLCVVLFRDETPCMLPTTFTLLPVELRLVPERQGLHEVPCSYDPFKDKAHPTMGYYRFLEPAALADADGSKLINPPGLPASGLIDFVRRCYQLYPADAVCC